MPENRNDVNASNGYNPDGIDTASENVPVNNNTGSTAGNLIHMGNSARSMAQGYKKKGANNVPDASSNASNPATGIAPRNTKPGENAPEQNIPGKKQNNLPGDKQDGGNNNLSNANQNNNLDTENIDANKLNAKDNKNNNLDNNKNDIAKGVGLPKKDDRPSAKDMPGVKGKNDLNKKKPNEKGNLMNKKGDRKPNPLAALGSRVLNRNKNKDNDKDKNNNVASSNEGQTEEKESSGNFFADMAKNGLRAAFVVLPPQVKAIIYVAIPVAFILIALLFVLALLVTTTTTMMDAEECNQSEYSTSVGNDADTDTFMCSMAKPLKNITVTSLYGWRNFNLGHMHNGVDLGASCGTSVYAVHDGTVVFAGTSSGYGNAVQLEHSNGITTWYAHLSKIEVSTGQKVKQGSEIAKSGNTGGNYPCHLHFEVRKNKSLESSVSPNSYFGYSDKGYEQCFDRNKTTRNCGFDESGAARKIKNNEKSQTCNITSSYFNEGDNSQCCETTETGTSTSLVDFLTKFEGAGKSCTTSKGSKGYLAENLGDGAITAGPGVTNAPVGSSDSQTIILSSSDKSGFVMSGGKYVMKVGGCYNKEIIDKIFMSSLEKSYGAAASKSAQKYGVNFSNYEKDAITSLNYNLGSGYSDKFVKAYKDDGYKGFWNSIKNLVHSQGRTLDGLKKRRKAEFALFVTGDYTDKGLFYSRGLNNYDDYDSEGVMARKASGSSSSCEESSGSLATGDRKAVVEVAQREYAKWRAGSEDHCSMKNKYLKSCGAGGCSLAWCAAFTSYVLREAGVADKIGLPKSCIANVANNAKNVTVHKAGGSYVPKPGDIITFDWSGARSTHNHVGIVEFVEGKTVHTIEGNSSNAINKRTYDINSRFVYDYITY